MNTTLKKIQTSHRRAEIQGVALHTGTGIPLVEADLDAIFGGAGDIDFGDAQDRELGMALGRTETIVSARDVARCV